MGETGEPRTGGGKQRTGRSRAMADIMPVVGRAAFRRFGFVQSSVVSRWPEIVGDRYSEVSAPDSIRFPSGERDGGTLTLVVEGAFAPLLQQVTPEIIERVNRFFGYRAVSRVVLRHGAIKQRRRSDRAQKREEPLPEEMNSSLRAIADDGLRTCLESLARQVCATDGPPVIDRLPRIK
ncbi:hypothetical protein BSL82_00350 [Tardibacter chloracetimidivorans]|uniref:RNA-binding protein n=1 Tax=Tardibacter chloracetimidivorans TaxID=1921510 RepID=A0A1L3ZQP0_9SPHN|nr:DciA family protein [Tardibacter chloracetimidivorans]API57941.1 hypothetical protein BSL82_00350 [Tardibacter chloracetimidivorans]